MKRIIAALAVAVLWATPAAAGSFADAKQLAKVKAVFVKVQQDAKGGCLLQAEKLKGEAERVLGKAGVKVLKEPTTASHILEITATSNAISGVNGCAVKFDIDIYRWEPLADNTVGRVYAESVGGMFWGPKESLPGVLQKATDQTVAGLGARIRKAQGK